MLRGLSNLDSLSARILNFPGMSNSECYTVFQAPIEEPIHRFEEWIPPCLLIYETTVVLSVNIMIQECWM